MNICSFEYMFIIIKERMFVNSTFIRITGEAGFLLTFFLYIQKKKVISLQQQIGDLQNKISILEKQYLAAEQYKDFLRQEAYTVHLYASLSLEEAKKHP